MVKVNCQECGKEFEAQPHDLKKGYGKYCSRQCYYKGRPKGKIKVNCQECGKEFETFPAYIKAGGGKYCSNVCYGKARSKIYVGKNHPTWQRVKRICEECKKEFETIPSHAKNGDGTYCSKKCMSKAYAKRFAGKNNPSWKGGDVKVVCEECKKEFEIPQRQIKQGKINYCSFSCKGKAQERILLGEKNPHWLGGISFEPYCPKFTKKFKERVRAFFGYKCAECFTPQKDRKLHVHHVNFNKMSCCDNTIPLFVPLCTSCHMKTNGKREYWESHFRDMIEKYYQGKCYFSQEEMDCQQM
jgi:hypothetical protein